MKKIIFLAIMAFILISSTAYSGDVDLVRDGVLYGHESTTVGKALEASFFDWEWIEYKSDKGQRIVEFNGRITSGLHRDFIEMINGELTIVELFALAETYGYILPQELDEPKRRQEAINWAFSKIWQEGTDFTAQFAILVNPEGGSKYFEVSNMEVAGQKVDQNTMLDLIYK